jgi:hypothetical protein
MESENRSKIRTLEATIASAAATMDSAKGQVREIKADLGLANSTIGSLGRLVGEVAKYVTTDNVDGMTYGTLLALELNKGTADDATMTKVLNKMRCDSDQVQMSNSQTVCAREVQTPTSHALCVGLTCV